MNTAFDPFNDRLARDIRNSLSAALIAALTSGDDGDMERSAARWLAGDLPPACRDYIADRMQRYREAALAARRRQGVSSAVATARLLWNRGLFFETHELLERSWKEAAGGRRDALKGLIQAAGVFVHAGHGNAAAARRLAARSRALLSDRGRHLPEIANLEELVESLGKPLSEPPRLRAPDDERGARQRITP